MRRARLGPAIVLRPIRVPQREAVPGAPLRRPQSRVPRPEAVWGVSRERTLAARRSRARLRLARARARPRPPLGHAQLRAQASPRASRAAVAHRRGGRARAVVAQSLWRRPVELVMRAPRRAARGPRPRAARFRARALR